MEVSFYPGCTAHSTGIEYTLSTRAVLDALGVSVTEIDDWNCCGAAAAHSLNRMLGLALPARNIAKAQEHDLPLVVPCPGCFNTLKSAQHALVSDEETRKELETIVGFRYKGGLEIRALYDVILNSIGLDRVRSAVKKSLSGLRVVSYYGCALVRTPEVVGVTEYENPLFLDEIVAALGAQAVEWSYKTDCCGADLGMTHGAPAREIADRITGMAREAGADCVMTSCGLCQINLDMKQTGAGGDRIPVLYFTELMGIAMDLPGREKWWPKHIVGVKPLLKSRDLV